ncbi:MAG: hypothetical protein LUG16_00175 [Candidatus Gastranaerophilales bacterium]|nr:hypothetical protein [Candidatus Gastranaerophilales bacterium]
MKINTELIPETDIKMLSITLLESAKKFYNDPQNVKTFKEWQKQRSTNCGTCISKKK